MEEDETEVIDSGTNDGDVTEDSLHNLLEDVDLSGEEVTEEGSQEADEETEEESTETEEETAEETEETEESEEETEEVEESEEEEEESEEDESEEDEPKVSKRVQDRFDELTRKRREAEERVAELEKELEESKSQIELSSAPPAPTGEYDHLETLQAVKDAHDDALSVIHWAEDNPDGTVVTQKDGTEKEYSAEDMRQIKRNAQRARETGLPDRYRYLQNVDQMNKVAKQEYPDLADSSSDFSKRVERVLKKLPALKQLPEYMLVAADFVRGAKAREDAKKEAEKAKEEAKKEPKKVLKKRKKVPIKRKVPSAQRKLKVRRGDMSESDLADALAGLVD